jgi:tRNA-guanine family transglycosylase
MVCFLNLDVLSLRDVEMFRFIDPLRALRLIPNFADVLKTLEVHRRTIWLGQSVDTSTIHNAYEDFSTLPILTSLGCAMRRPRAVSKKFDVNLRARIGANTRLMVDSGGFVLMTKQEPKWNVGRVSRLYRQIDANHLVSLDIPPSSSDTSGDRIRKYRRAANNLQKLYDQFGEKVVPVVHGLTRAEIEKNCRLIESVYPSPKFIGIGGLVPALKRCGLVKKSGPNTPQRWLAASVAFTRAHFPQAQLHLFGIGSIHNALGAVAIGVDSIDSIGWRQAAGFGYVYIPGRHQRIVTLRNQNVPRRPPVDVEDIEALSHCQCPECRLAKTHQIKIHRLASHYKPRAVHNIWVLYSEIAEYLRACEAGKGGPFISVRLSDAWLDALDGR